MTKEHDKENQEVEASKQTGVPHVEVTPEMIEAGCEVYAHNHPDSYVRVVAERVVVDVFKAMASMRS